MNTEQLKAAALKVLCAARKQGLPENVALSAHARVRRHDGSGFRTDMLEVSIHQEGPMGARGHFSMTFYANAKADRVASVVVAAAFAAFAD